MLTLVSTSDYVERLVFNLIASGQYLKHQRRLKAHVERATREALPALKSVGLALPYAPGGGFYLWARLKPGQDELALASEASDASIFLAPGAIFMPERGQLTSALRVNIAYATDPRFLAFMKRRLAR